jgi:hypothetical protein
MRKDHTQTYLARNRSLSTRIKNLPHPIEAHQKYHRYYHTHNYQKNTTKVSSYPTTSYCYSIRTHSRVRPLANS